MDGLKKEISGLRAEVKEAADRLGLDKLTTELEQLRTKMDGSDFWLDNKGAQETTKKESAIAKRVEPWLDLQKSTSELDDLASLDDQTLQDEIRQQLDAAKSRFNALKKELRFQGPYDDHGVVLSIHAGAGGTDAQDWAQMLMRMYVRWAEAHGVQVKTVDQSMGEEAGIKSVDLELTGGSLLYGKLAGEHGVHRLVRLSPFNADHLRQTSFAKVEVAPVIDQPAEVEIDNKDLKVDVFRAGGHGGQSVNTTDSAVRVTHLPTGITVAIQNERSQLQNKETALKILRGKLAQLQLEQHADDLSQLKGHSQSAEWGNQIRNYVLHPYKQVKDVRTGYESSDVEKVLDGGLDPLIDAYINSR